MIRNLEKALLVITQPITDKATIRSSISLTPKKEFIDIFEVAQEIYSMLSERIRNGKPPSYDEDKDKILKSLRKLDEEKINKILRNAPDTLEIISYLAEIFEALPDKNGLLKLAAHAIKAFSYYELKSSNEALERLIYLIWYLLTAHSELLNENEEKAREIIDRVIIPGYEKELSKILESAQ